MASDEEVCHFRGIVGRMNLVESIERGLDWLSAPKRLPGRLEMETQRGRRLELEVVSLTIRMPVAGGVVLKLPVFMTVLPAGSSPVEGSHARSDHDVEKQDPAGAKGDR
ncbi:hypothetical protein MMAGJ_23380 [Mycolicibacterium mageritense]|uniref:Uncharacterized protein n=2 Tax=Mycobacteriaceae TaxID=1762 RepID=A0AAI8TT26_MYCME|nr:hypothetical protein MMAGJ_23380 [Mycolicibacterium mageritense]BDY28321.1 hypothetical protein hbim_02255 [Mycolicibacterium mageritense]GJJ22836.1 hypothetical protein MTY414_65090 [Mycolicibacterium mageritense]CDO21492.1 hypothetical protein BN978_01953 [Mycolicibacterium mageritense DSM 44476 = CIP 104973]